MTHVRLNARIRRMRTPLKELVKHLRTVHFTLAVLGLVLFVAALEPPKAPLQRAYDDAVAILHLSEHWTEWGQQFTDAAQRTASKNAAQFSELITFRIDKPNSKAKLFSSKELEYLQQMSGRYLNGGVLLVTVKDRHEAAPLDVYMMGGFKNLREFKEFWDERHVRVHRLAAVADDSLHCDPSIIVGPLGTARITTEHLPYKPRPGGLGSVEAGMAFGSDKWTIPDPSGSDATFQFETGLWAPARCSISAIVRSVDIDARDVTAKVAGRSDLVRASYSVAFSDLETKSRNLVELPLLDLAQEMRDRLVADGERFEVFGAHIPAEQIIVLGPILIVLCQLYFWLQLRQIQAVLKGRTLEDIPLGYIGLYRGRFNSIFTSLSLTLPLGAAYFEIWVRTLPSPSLAKSHAIVWLGFCTLSSASIATGQIATFRSIRRRKSSIVHFPAEGLNLPLQGSKPEQSRVAPKADASNAKPEG